MEGLGRHSGKVTLMNRWYVVGVILSVVAESLAADTAAVGLRQPWEAPYTGDDAKGSNVIALWSFTAGAELEDASGHKHTLKLHGAQTNPKGRFGGCLESFRGYPVEDKRHAAAAADHPDLSPTGAFSFEMWINAKPELNDYAESFLLDKKYVSHADYQWILGAADRSGKRSMRVVLGFGGDSDHFYSTPFDLAPGQWHHIAFTYDGQGLGSFILDGSPVGSTLRQGRKGIVGGKHLLSIGDRFGSLYHGFPGLIDEVRICKGAMEFRRARLVLNSPRSNFLRLEKAVVLPLAVTNLDRQPLANATLTVRIAGTANTPFRLPRIESGQTHTVDYPLDTTLRPDAYLLHATLAHPSIPQGTSEVSFPLRIVARRLPHRFPVLMWGGYNPHNAQEEISRLKQIGFTHVLGIGANLQRVRDEGLPDDAEGVKAAGNMLDQALANDLSIMATLSPGSDLRRQEGYQRVDRQGKHYKSEDVCGLFPEAPVLCEKVGTAIGKAYSRYPAFEGALIHTEVRDHAQLCFHEHDRAAYRQATGADIPDEATSKWGVQYGKLKGFPPSRIIPDDDPLYRYFRWYWKQGDGWNALNSAVHRGLKSCGRSNLWTFNDPAVRVASVYGSGGEVDILSHWTYSYPDPIRIALATDDLLAMAGGASQPQAVMKMTQIIWYRTQTAPRPEPASRPASRPAADGPPLDTLAHQPEADAASGVEPALWEIEQPDAPFITIAPMHLREAFWTKIARPIRGIMYHGWQSLVPVEPPAGYRYTNPQTQHELTRLIDTVVKPLGPTLLQVPASRSDVAFLQSFASQMFAGRGSYGWGRGWGADAYHIMLYAHLQPEIVYDETLVARGLDSFRVLVMCDCDVVTQKMAERVRAFQKGGGLVIGDERLAPGLKADILIASCQRSGKADDDKAALIGKAAQLRKDLDARYTRHVDTSNPDILPYRRSQKDADYVFLVNDRREFGTYVGQHGRVMENGLPADAAVSVNRKNGVVYDLVAGRRVPAELRGTRLTFDAHLGPCEGAMLMIVPREIAAVGITAPEKVRRGSGFTCRLEIHDAEAKRVDAIVPLSVGIRDAEGRQAEFSGYYGAAGGAVEIPLHIASNDAPGIWTIEAKELAGGHTTRRYVRVER